MADPVALKRTEQAADTRGRLLVAARRAFEARGYGATSTEELRAQIGLTRGGFYHHFADKRALFREVFEAEATALAELVKSQTDRFGDPGEALRAQATTWLQHVWHPGPAQVLVIDAPAVLDDPDFWLISPFLATIAAVQGDATDRMSVETQATARSLVGSLGRLAVWVLRSHPRPEPAALRAALRIVDAV